jgi:hypothetical protein
MNESFSPHPYLCSELVSIAPARAIGDSRSFTGNLEAIGEWSLLILTEVPVRRGTEIRISTKAHTLNGIVEWCNFDEPLGCYLQVRLKSESRWSQRWFKPKHLLPPIVNEGVGSRKCA